MKRQIFLLSLLIFTSSVLLAQKGIWNTLAKISYKKQYDDLMGFEVDIPVFGEEVMALEGTEIEVEGYVIPVEGYDMQENFVFSAFPYAMCFFCGNAGPETVMEAYVKSEKIKYTSKPIKIKGILSLNAGDINSLMYILNDVEVVN